MAHGSAKDNGRQSTLGYIASILGLFLCLVFGSLLVCNLVLIVKGALRPETPPSVLGVTPMVVLSGSMSGTQEGHIEVGDLIFVTKVQPQDLKVGDVIAYMDGSMPVTHRIVGVNTDQGLSFITKGDANNAPDPQPIPQEKVLGICIGRIPKLGDFALFLHQPAGMILFIGLPLLAFAGVDFFRRRKDDQAQQAHTRALEEELERLRKEQK